MLAEAEDDVYQCRSDLKESDNCSFLTTTSKAGFQLVPYWFRSYDPKLGPSSPDSNKTPTVMLARLTSPAN
ncbi:hypothetical protein JHK84_044391 [Glycine max]|nr:hypothetical protein JHK84_044391 [Glycine max]